MRSRSELLKSYKNKINLNPDEIRLMLTIVRIYDFIIKNPPIGSSKYHALNAWERFYRIYDKYLETLTKSFWLMHYTFLISYRKYYNLKDGIQEKELSLKDGIQEKELILKFNRKKDKFSTFIYEQYKHLDKNVTLEELDYWGY